MSWPCWFLLQSGHLGVKDQHHAGPCKASLDRMWLCHLKIEEKQKKKNDQGIQYHKMCNQDKKVVFIFFICHIEKSVRVHVRVHVCVCVHEPQHTWRLEDNLQEWVLAFHHVDAEFQTRVSLPAWGLNPRSHFPKPNNQIGETTILSTPFYSFITK